MRFVMVDRILVLEPGKRIEAVKTLSASELLFRDHFPGFPVVPGVLLTEMLAQAAGRCLDAETGERGKSMLGKILSASFREWVRPDEEATIRAEITQNRARFATASGTITVHDREACSAELFFVFAARSLFADDYRDEVLENYYESHAGEGESS